MPLIKTLQGSHTNLKESEPESSYCTDINRSGEGRSEGCNSVPDDGRIDPKPAPCAGGTCTPTNIGCLQTCNIIDGTIIRYYDAFRVSAPARLAVASLLMGHVSPLRCSPIFHPGLSRTSLKLSFVSISVIL